MSQDGVFFINREKRFSESIQTKHSNSVRILGVLVFLADLFIPSGMIISLLYIPVVGMACRVASRKTAFMVHSDGVGVDRVGSGVVCLGE